MNFNSLDYLLFLVVVVTAYYALPRRGLQNALLVGASWFFYGYVHPWFLLLLASATLAAYLAGLAIETRPTRRKLALTASLIVNLGILALFKYYNFFADNLRAALGALGLTTPELYLQILLPVGISFYTFQAMSYVVDVYRGDRRAERNPVDFALFVSFFPQLVAGPIERANMLLAQIKRDRGFEPRNLIDGATLAMWGFFKKLVIGDNVAVIVNKIFLLQEPGTALLCVGILAFAVQIYADFSGYTDIARGSARLLGFRLSENFRHPYFSESPAEFWRRWHITLSQWIRDYIYIPLGGSRVSRPREFANLMITFFLCGLWHGAQWNFVLWGVYHGLLIYAYRIAAAFGVPLSGGGVVQKSLRVLVMFGFTNIGWALFREPDLAYLAHNLNPLSTHRDAPGLQTALYLLVLTGLYAAPLALHAIYDKLRVGERLAAAPTRPLAILLRHGAFAAVCLLAVGLFGATTTADFIYFQF
jgi:alginate O-acetyltransferase complex protein AlgI